MDRKLRKQFVSLILSMSLVLPMVVGLHHAVHEHDQVVCSAQNESHFHSQGVDCDHQHYFNPGGLVDQVSPDQSLTRGYSADDAWGDPCPKLKPWALNCSLRGPPMINV